MRPLAQAVEPLADTNNLLSLKHYELEQLARGYRTDPVSFLGANPLYAQVQAFGADQIDFLKIRQYQSFIGTSKDERQQVQAPVADFDLLLRGSLDQIKIIAGWNKAVYEPADQQGFEVLSA
jgi:hypothetical protein